MDFHLLTAVFPSFNCWISIFQLLDFHPLLTSLDFYLSTACGTLLLRPATQLGGSIYAHTGGMKFHKEYFHREGTKGPVRVVCERNQLVKAPISKIIQKTKQVCSSHRQIGFWISFLDGNIHLKNYHANMYATYVIIFTLLRKVYGEKHFALVGILRVLAPGFRV